jgi:translation elongation factor EF-Ts
MNADDELYQQRCEFINKMVFEEISEEAQEDLLLQYDDLYDKLQAIKELPEKMDKTKVNKGQPVSRYGVGYNKAINDYNYELNKIIKEK